MNVQLPIIPEDVIQGNGTHRHIHASENDGTGKLVAVNLWQVSVSIPVSDFIPKSDGPVPLEGEFRRNSGNFERIADEILDYWIRVMRWKLDYPKIENEDHFPRVNAQISSDVIDTDTGSVIWPKMRGYFASAEKYFRLNLDNWSDVRTVLASTPTTPLWADYFGYAQLRKKNGDSTAALIDLAISCEARIRKIVHSQLPDNTPESEKAKVDRKPLKDLIKEWD